MLSNEYKLLYLPYRTKDKFLQLTLLSDESARQNHLGRFLRMPYTAFVGCFICPSEPPGKILAHKQHSLSQLFCLSAKTTWESYCTHLQIPCFVQPTLGCSEHIQICSFPILFTTHTTFIFYHYHYQS